MIDTHILEVRMPLRTEYLSFTSEENARSTAFDALQNGVLAYTEFAEMHVPQGTTFRILTKDSQIVENIFKHKRR